MIYTILGLLILACCLISFDYLVKQEDSQYARLLHVLWVCAAITGIILFSTPISEIEEIDGKTYTYQETCHLIGGEFIETKEGYACIAE